MTNDTKSASPLSRRLIRGSTAFDKIVNGIKQGKKDKLFDCGYALRGIEIGPGILTLIGAPPGRGKTALTMQATYEAVQREPGLHAVVASLEVTEETLIKRRIAKEIGVSFEAVRFNRLTDRQRSKIAGLSKFREMLDSIDFVPESACGLGDLKTLMTDRVKPGLLVLDYIQLFGSEMDDPKARAALTMATARRFCAEGWAVVAVSAFSRNQSISGRSRTKGASLESFRDSSAIEYSGAAAYALDEASNCKGVDPPPIRQMSLRCLKNRNGECRHINLWFNGPQLSFSRDEPDTDTVSANSSPSESQGGVF
ncbi:replicative DNA helicase [Roseimaritima multifibrata]|uniref:Replicative DNA helicase n=1 Tax=Roseimaritima multifibrata TaxID=1930274 RepID=A0A517MAC6_9BACT|nr:DnaB-like helicase C-terminal domain-containing protein [Roseimaritima multifibrata]QDS91833.1 replicative DNA helicase [Roseimaritima multifibrata]